MSTNRDDTPAIGNLSRLTIPNDLSYLAPALSLVASIARMRGFSDEETRSLSLAIEEALSNAIEHGFEPGERSSVEVECEDTASSLTVVVRDKGMPFDPSRAPQFDPSRLTLDEASTAGLGLFLMRRSVDELEYRNLGRRGKEIRLKKFKASARIDTNLPRFEPPAHHLPQPEAAALTIRPLRAEEALEVSRCAYKAYGYTYEDYIYYPDQIVSLNECGIMHSVVAVTNDQVSGHCALKLNRPSDVIAEIGVAFVRPEYRGRGTLRRMMMACFERASALGLWGVMGRAVTSHVVSQKTSAEVGLKPCGILLAAFPDDVEFKKLSGQVSQRESAVLLYCPMRSKPGRALYVPHQHQQMVQHIYDWLERPLMFAQGDGESAGDEPGPTSLRTRTVNVLNATEIEVFRQGADAVEAIGQQVHRECVARRDVVYLYLDLEDRLTPKTAAALESQGFLFAGVLPDALEGHDAMVLQYLNNLSFDLQSVNPWSKQATEILDHIRSQESVRRLAR